MKKYLYLFLLPFLFLAGTCHASFGYYKAITTVHAKVSNADQSNFPVVATTTDANLATVGNGGKVQNANGYDIYCYSDQALTTRIPCEREYYNASTGQAIWWIKFSTIHTASDDTVYFGLGDATISTDPNSDGTYGKTAVWDANYRAVWHLPNGTSLSGTDSTSNAFNLTNNNAVTAVAGQIDGGAHFVPASSQTLSSSMTMSGTSDITVSFWANVPSAVAGGFSGSASSGYLQAHVPYTDGNLYWDYGNNSSGRVAVSISTFIGSWHYYTLIAKGNNTSQKIYVDGVQKATQSSGAAPTGISSFEFGQDISGNFWNANADEFRVSNIVRTPDWITTEYNNQSSVGTFLTFGSVTAVGGGGGSTNVLSWLYVFLFGSW